MTIQSNAKQIMRLDTLNHSDPPILFSKSEGEITPMIHKISKISRPKYDQGITFGGRGYGGKAHILGIVHGQVVHIEWQHGA